MKGARVNHQCSITSAQNHPVLKISEDSHHLVHTVGALRTQEGWMPGAEVTYAEIQGDDCGTWAESGADTEAPGARAASEVAAASSQLTRLGAKLGPEPGTVCMSWPLYSRRVPHKLCRANSGGGVRRPSPACLPLLALPGRGQRV